ncbi:type I restriction enzyme endonuclease domain-containing protein [Francisella persica]|uniref:type I restriction enzyme endonuclease domain-containing protein n=1 Tax=Francisella persica TaxID=954 RepID=UPI00202A4F0D|nr:type I restriction enzyme endonuclease domain-containing protein [Francisella persica]
MLIAKTLRICRYPIVIVKDQLDLLAKLFHKFDNSRYFASSPIEQLNCLNFASEYIHKKLEIRFMYIVKKLKADYDICCCRCF